MLLCAGWWPTSDEISRLRVPHICLLLADVGAHTAGDFIGFGGTWRHRKLNQNSVRFASALIRSVRWERRSSSRCLKQRCSGAWLGKPEVVLQNHMRRKGRSPWRSPSRVGYVPSVPRFPEYSRELRMLERPSIRINPRSLLMKGAG